MCKSDFQWLLAPVEPERFLQEYWDRATLFVPRKKPDYYSGLFSLGSADEVIGLCRFRPGDVRFLPDDQAVDPMDLSLTEEGFADSSQLYGKYQQGATLLFHRIDKYWHPITQLGRNLTGFFRMPTGATAVVSPPGVHSSPPHFDFTNNFLLQIEGTKRYRVYDATDPLPLMKDEKPYIVSREQLGVPLLDVEVEPGDLLFIPRGVVHEGFASREGSLHVTVGVTCFTWSDLLAETVQALSRQHVALRRAVPPAMLSSVEPPSGAVAETYGAMLRVLLEEADLGQAIDGLTARLVRQLRGLPANHLAHLNRAGHIDLDTVVCRRKGTFCRTASDSQTASIHFPGSTIRGPRSTSAALRFIASVEQFPVRDLPGLTDTSKLTLARRLLWEGLLQIADPLSAE